MSGPGQCTNCQHCLGAGIRSRAPREPIPVIIMAANSDDPFTDVVGHLTDRGRVDSPLESMRALLVIARTQICQAQIQQKGKDTKRCIKTLTAVRGCKVMFRPFVIPMTGTASVRSVYHSGSFVLNEASPREKDWVKSRIGVVQTSITVKLDTINPGHNRAGVQGFE